MYQTFHSRHNCPFVSSGDDVVLQPAWPAPIMNPTILLSEASSRIYVEAADSSTDASALAYTIRLDPSFSMNLQAISYAFNFVSPKNSTPVVAIAIWDTSSAGVPTAVSDPITFYPISVASSGSSCSAEGAVTVDITPKTAGHDVYASIFIMWRSFVADDFYGFFSLRQVVRDVQVFQPLK